MVAYTQCYRSTGRQTLVSVPWSYKRLPDRYDVFNYVCIYINSTSSSCHTALL